MRLVLSFINFVHVHVAKSDVGHSWASRAGNAEANTTEGDIDECADVSECGSQDLDKCDSQQSDIEAETEGTKHHIRCVCHDRVLCTGGQGGSFPTPPPKSLVKSKVQLGFWVQNALKIFSGNTPPAPP